MHKDRVDGNYYTPNEHYLEARNRELKQRIIELEEEIKWLKEQLRRERLDRSGG